MALQFVLGGSGSGKSEYVQNLAFELSKDRNNNIWMIVPDQFTMQTQQKMATSHPDGGILNIDVLSFSRLPRKIFEEVGCPKRLLLDDTGKCLLVRRAASKHKDELRVLSKGMNNPGWAAEVKSAISEFMQYNITVSDMDKLIIKAEENPALERKLCDLKLLYEGFLEECEDKYLTKEEMLDLVANRIPLSEKLEGSVVIFDGFTGFTPIQVKVITEILLKAKEVIITFPFDNDISISSTGFGNDGYLFELTRQNVKELTDAASQNGIKTKEDIRLTFNHRSSTNAALSHLEKNLFRASRFEKITAGEKIRIVKCGNIDNECHILCEALFNDIKKEGYRYRDVAVVCGDMTKYEKPLEKYLTKYNVPFYMDSNRNINNNLLVRYLTSAIAVMQNRFAADDVVKFLRCGLFEFNEAEIDRLENYIYARGIKGIKRWSEPFLYQSDEMKTNEENLSEMNELRERFMAAFNPFLTDNSFKKRPLKDWVLCLYEMLEQTDTSDKLTQISEAMTKEGRIVEAMEYKAVYDKVISLFEQITDLMGDEIFTVKELSDLLKVGFSEIKVGVLPQKADSLLVGDMERTRLREIKALYFVGVNDGNVPKSSEAGGILSLPEKEFLKTKDAKKEDDFEVRLSPTPAEQAFIEQLYLYLNVTKPTDKLYISYATVGAKGDSLIPSYFTEVVKGLYTDLADENRSQNSVRLSFDDIKEETGRLISMYAANQTSKDEERALLANLGILNNNEENAKWCEKIIANAYKEYTPTKILSETAKELYGTLLTVSVSTLESFAQCEFAHFAVHGLGLSEREEYGLENRDIGNLSHDVLEEVGRELSRQKLDFSTALKEVLKKEVDDAIEKVTKDYGGDVLSADEKTKYYLTQLRRIMLRTVDTLGYQLSKGKFTPRVYEKSFSRIYESQDEDLKDVKVNLKGRIDRIDVYSDDTNDEYVKIIDYKSSQKKFDPELLEAGVSLQLSIYMKSAVEALKEMHPNKNVKAGAMLYYAIDDPFVGKGEDSKCEIRKKLIPTGAIANDDKVVEALDPELLIPQSKSDVVPAGKKKDNGFTAGSSVYSVEEFEGMLKMAGDIAIENSKKMLRGEVSINPLSDKKIDACKYCALKGVCGFDQRIPGYVKRTLNGGEAFEEENEEE